MDGKWTYYPDIDAKNGVRLRTIEKKIKYLEGRIQKIVVVPVDEFFLLRESNENIRHLNLAIFGVICDAIVGLSEFLPTPRGKPKPQGKKDSEGKLRFLQFAMEYLYPSDHCRHQYAEKLWKDFRNPMAHGFHIRNGSIEDDPNLHFAYDSEHKTLSLHLEGFFNDFKNGAKRFFDELKKPESTQLRIAFQKTFNGFFSVLIPKNGG